MSQQAEDPIAAQIAALADLIVDAERFIVFTGAGISTESGIPDFRSPNGIWNRTKPIDLQRFLSSDEAKREYWRRGRNTYAVINNAQPNPAHLALVELERLGKLDLIITQNIDGLHQKAGSSPDRVIELHGTVHRIYCMNCGQEESRQSIMARLEAGETLPTCRNCGGTLRSATIAFGEPLPQEPLMRAVEAAQRSDFFLVIGSSLVVNPAAQLPQIAAQAGAYVAIINQSPTPLDALACLLVRGQAGEVMAKVLAAVQGQLAGDEERHANQGAQ